jgi:hypothetical protein
VELNHQFCGVEVKTGSATTHANLHFILEEGKRQPELCVGFRKDKEIIPKEKFSGWEAATSKLFPELNDIFQFEGMTQVCDGNEFVTN